MDSNRYRRRSYIPRDAPLRATSNLIVKREAIVPSFRQAAAYSEKSTDTSKHHRRLRLDSIWPQGLSNLYEKLYIRVTLAALMLIVFLIVMAINFSPTTSKMPPKNSTVENGSQIVGTAEIQNPNKLQTVSGNSPIIPLSTTQSESVPATFKPLAPADKPQLANLGSTAFNKAYASYTYKDLLAALPLQVSQQRLTLDMIKYGGVSEIAKTLKATATFSTNTGPAYLAHNTSTKSETIIYAKKNMLILIKSEYSHPASLWANYLNNLE